MSTDLITRQSISEATGIPRGSIKAELEQAGIEPQEKIIENGCFKYLYHPSAIKKVSDHVQEKNRRRKADTIRMVVSHR